MIKSVVKAIDIMNVFSPDEPRLTLGEIARRLDLPKSTAHNLLNTLSAYGLIERTEDDRYALGTALISLTQSVRVNVELRDRAAQLIRQLADDCRETIYLTAFERDHSLYIYAVESPRRLLARTAVGDRVPMHCTSVGKATLSALPQAEVEAIVERVGLTAFTANTITDLTTLHAELAETRARGYAIDRAEHEVGTYCLGAPIFNGRGQVVGAISISSSDPSIVGDHQEELAALLKNTAHNISRLMGYVPNRVSAVPTSLP